MTRLTVRLPDSLHAMLIAHSQKENVTLNQYIVYALTRQMTQGYRLRIVPETERKQQRAEYRALRERLGAPATQAQAEKFLARRQPVEPEADLPPEIVDRLQRRIARQQRAARKPSKKPA
jgi:hypothetical protein